MVDIGTLTSGHNDEIGRIVQDHLLVAMYVSSKVALHDHCALHGFTNLAIKFWIIHIYNTV